MFVEQFKDLSDDTYISDKLLKLVQNYIPPEYAKEDNGLRIFSLNNKSLSIGDTVYYKKESIELIIKSIDKIDNDIIVTMHDGTELMADGDKIEVYKNGTI